MSKEQLAAAFIAAVGTLSSKPVPVTALPEVQVPLFQVSSSPDTGRTVSLTFLILHNTLIRKGTDSGQHSYEWSS
jgi:hypothetical protein